MVVWDVFDEHWAQCVHILCCDTHFGIAIADLKPRYDDWFRVLRFDDVWTKEWMNTVECSTAQYSTAIARSQTQTNIQPNWKMVKLKIENGMYSNTERFRIFGKEHLAGMPSNWIQVRLMLLTQTQIDAFARSLAQSHTSPHIEMKLYLPYTHLAHR